MGEIIGEDQLPRVNTMWDVFAISVLIKWKDETELFGGREGVRKMALSRCAPRVGSEHY